MRAIDIVINLACVVVVLVVVAAWWCRLVGQIRRERQAREIVRALEEKGYWMREEEE